MVNFSSWLPRLAIITGLLMSPLSGLAQPNGNIVPVITSLLNDNCGGSTFPNDKLLVGQDDPITLEGVGKIAGYLYLDPTFVGLDLSPLSTLSEITGDFGMGDVIFQTNLNGLGCLRKVGGGLLLLNTPLTSLAGIKILKSKAIQGTIEVSKNTALDCGNPIPSFAPVDRSWGNLVNCPLKYQNILIATIPDNDANGITDTIVVTEPGTIADLMVGLNIEHTYMYDIIVTLTHSGTGTSIQLVNQPKKHMVPTQHCVGDDIHNTLGDQAALSVDADCLESSPAYTQRISYKPSQPLSSFDGETLSGNWTIRVSDNAPSDEGILTSWSLQFDKSAAP